MTLGDIKLEALKLMFCNGEEDIRAEDLDGLATTEPYDAYLVNMVGSLNRCFADLENKGVMPLRSAELRASDGERGLFGIRFDLGAIEGFLALERVIYENDAGEYNGHAPYRMEENVLILPEINDGHEVYRVLYHARLPRYSPDQSNDTELPIPDHIAAYIPYFIKGELYRDDEPNEAGEARNWYESGVSGRMENRRHSGNAVVSVYTQEG